jgi:hypothetical protein
VLYKLLNNYYFSILLLLCLCILYYDIVDKALRAVVNDSFSIRGDIIVYARDVNNITVLT